MERLLDAFASNFMLGAKQLLEIAARPRHRCSVGVDWAPLVRNQNSIFRSAPLVIARSLLVRAVTPPIPMELFHSDHFPARAWGNSDVSRNSFACKMSRLCHCPTFILVRQDYPPTRFSSGS
jgi:hypothetical protein